MARHLQLTLIALFSLLSSCLGMPDNIAPVSGFDVNRYLGTWYEIARLDHSFERGLQQVTATYSLREDGGIDVVNRGYNSQKKAWKQADGKAYFVEGEDIGYLKVSFFGPFYGSYIVFELDQDNYDYAFVAGPNDDYLWLLARQPAVDEALTNRFIDTAKAKGFDVDKLEFITQSALL